jgi:hypothetical protein
MKSVNSDNRPAWAQQPGESAESFAAFVGFRDRGPARTLAESRRLIGESQTGPKGASRKRKASGCIRRRSTRRKWFERAALWDAMLEAERVAAIIKAVRKEGKKWAARYDEARERAWEKMTALDAPLDSLIARPIMRVHTLKKALANPKTEADARQVTSMVNPAMDMLRAGRYQIELMQVCFGPLTLTEITSDSSNDELGKKVSSGEARIVSPMPPIPPPLENM